MKIFSVISFSLLAFGSVFATDFVSVISSISTRLEMPELFSANPAELTWFTERSLITEKVFFYNLLMSELKKPDSFPENRYAFAKYGLRAFFEMPQSDQLRVDADVLKKCLNILVKGRKFDYLFELTVKFGSQMIILMKWVELDAIKALTEVLLVSPLRDSFLEILKNYQPKSGFKICLYAQLIASDVPEHLFKESLLSNFMGLLIPAFVSAINKSASELPLDVAILHKIDIMFNQMVDSEYQAHLDEFKILLRIILSPANVSFADIGCVFSSLALDKKLGVAFHAANHDRIVLLKEIAANSNVAETMEVLKTLFASSKFVKPSGLKVAVKMYNLLPEDIRWPIHETQEYLQAAVHWLKLDHFEIFAEGDYLFKINFKADSEQIADGLFEEMTYYHRRGAPSTFVFMATYCFDLKFTSTESFKNFISQNIRGIFPEISDSSLPISKDSLNMLIDKEDLRLVTAQSGYKIMVKTDDILDYINETSIERIPSMANLIRTPFFDLDLLSNINETSNFPKLEKFVEKGIADILQNAIILLKRPVTEIDYFKIRNIVIYWMNSADRPRLNELPDLFKRMIINEFPEMALCLTLNETREI